MDHVNVCGSSASKKKGLGKIPKSELNSCNTENRSRLRKDQ